MPDSAILRFYSSASPDISGRRLHHILAWDDAALEAVHDYVQWLFPLPEASDFNPSAPLLTPADIAAFRQTPALQGSLRESLARMRRFYALPAGSPHWLTPHNHNMLRLTRILRCLRVLGLEAEARDLLAELEAVHDNGAASIIGPVTLGFWRRAVA